MARVLTKEEFEARRKAATPPERPAPTTTLPAIDSRALAEAIASAISKINIPTPQVQVTAQPSEVIMQAEAPRQWKFSIKRDKEGYISEITATAK